MPQHVRYIARRTLASGHSAGVQYLLDLSLDEKNPERRRKTSLAESLNGAVYTTYYKGYRAWAVMTVPLVDDDADAMREFLNSVEEGQVFGYADTRWANNPPPNYVSVIIEGAGYKEKRVKTGDQQSDHRFAFSFTMRQVPG